MQKPKGTIFEVHRFSLNDGPGIRTTIFLKGCPLSCSWCHNYESQDGKRQLYFDPEKCISCGNCQEVCPNDVHAFSIGEHTVVHDRCDFSGKCVEVCSTDALKIIGMEMEIKEVISEVEKDRAYYDRSGGGVTISGGEPMHQFAFLHDLVKALKVHNFHVCLDTSGFASTSLFYKILPFIDLFHFDVKSLDRDIHKRETGVELSVILENLHFIASHGKAITLRCPIVPGINDDKKHFKQLASLAFKYTSIEKIDLLPYHKMGIKKAKNLKKDMEITGFSEPTDQQKELWGTWISELTNTPFHIG